MRTNIFILIPNDLGKNRAVINGSTGTIEQAIAYYPYGGIIADLGTKPTSGQPYKFGGKELLTANGLNEYDFGARRYFQAVPHFTSVDPLSEKRPDLSPYLYCGNDPINAIDPTGKDIWTLDNMGRIIDSQSFDAFDMVLVFDQNKNLKDSWKGKYGSITNQSSRKDKDGNDYAFFETKNDEIGSSVFEFLAQNTSVEWSQFKTGTDELSTNYLSSSHEIDCDGGAASLINGRLSTLPIREWTHSHPLNTEYPSGLDPSNISGDIPFTKIIERVNSIQAVYKIYLPGRRKYIDYNSKSSMLDSKYDRYINRLPEIYITP